MGGNLGKCPVLIQSPGIFSSSVQHKSNVFISGNILYQHIPGAFVGIIQVADILAVIIPRDQITHIFIGFVDQSLPCSHTGTVALVKHADGDIQSYIFQILPEFTEINGCVIIGCCIFPYRNILFCSFRKSFLQSLPVKILSHFYFWNCFVIFIADHTRNIIVIGFIEISVCHKRIFFWFIGCFQIFGLVVSGACNIQSLYLFRVFKGKLIVKFAFRKIIHQRCYSVCLCQIVGFYFVMLIIVHFEGLD